MEIFALRSGVFIELHDLLKVTGVSPTGGAAKIAIAEGMVRVDGKVETRKRCKVKEGQIVQIGERQIKVAKPDDHEAKGDR